MVCWFRLEMNLAEVWTALVTACHIRKSQNRGKFRQGNLEKEKYDWVEFVDKWEMLVAF